MHLVPCTGLPGTLPRRTGRPVHVHLEPCTGAPSAPSRYTCHPAQVHRSLCSDTPGIRPGIHVTLQKCTAYAAQVTLLRCTCEHAQVHRLSRPGAQAILPWCTGHSNEVHLVPCTFPNIILSPFLALVHLVPVMCELVVGGRSVQTIWSADFKQPEMG